MRRRMIAGNWKMYKSAEKAIAFLDDLEGSFLPEKTVEVVICPPFVAIPALTGDPRVDLMGIHIGAQNGHWELEGAFTGEVSMGMLRETGCRYVIVGHSERRMRMGETDETVNKKVKEAMRVGLTPIICVGETAEQRRAGVTAEIITRQIQGAFQDVEYPEAKHLVVAYEPVWAIGSGTPASPEDAEEVHSLIRALLGDLNGSAWAEQVCILYGGSVKPDNIADFLQMAGIDGALVGGASLDPASFLSLIGKAAEGRL